jgi:hypothetical protein
VVEIGNHLFDSDFLLVRFFTKISHVRFNKREVVVMYSGASSEIGGGAWLTYDGVEILSEGFIRWTREELEMFIQHLVSSTLMKHVGVSINVLEFFSLVYLCDDGDTRSEVVM